MPASHVMRSRCSATIVEVAGVSAGSSIHALGEGRDDAAVERRVRWRAEFAAEDPFEVHGLDPAGRGQRRHDLVRPVGVRVELEAKLRIQLEPARHARDARRDDEAKRLRLSSDRLPERQPGLSERQVERGRLERPAPVLGLSRLEEREGFERVLARERHFDHPAPGTVSAASGRSRPPRRVLPRRARAARSPSGGG